MPTIDELTVRIDADMAPLRRQMNRVERQIELSTGDIVGRFDAVSAAVGRAGAAFASFPSPGGIAGPFGRLTRGPSENAPLIARAAKNKMEESAPDFSNVVKKIREQEHELGLVARERLALASGDPARLRFEKQAVELERKLAEIENGDKTALDFRAASAEVAKLEDVFDRVANVREKFTRLTSVRDTIREQKEALEVLQQRVQGNEKLLPLLRIQQQLRRQGLALLPGERRRIEDLIQD